MFHSLEAKLSESDKFFFLKFLLDTVKQQVINCDIPNILEQICLIQQAEEGLIHSEKQDYIPIYTKDTCMEFHLLFIVILNAFKVTLIGLNKTGEGKDPTKFPEHVVALRFIGYMLQLLAKSTVLQEHLETIESLLQEHHCINTISVADPELDEEEPDKDLEAIQPDVIGSGNLTPKMPLHMSYLEWLKLMIMHFDVIDVLKDYFQLVQF